MTEELIVAIIIRKDLGMSCGKIAVQAAHGITNMFMHMEEVGALYVRIVNKWYHECDQKKIILKVKDKSELHAIESELQYNNLPFEGITDLGLTQLKGETLTGICVYPMAHEQIDPIIRLLKLL